MTKIIEVPVLPLRDVVVFPQMVITLFVGREKSINALDQAMRNGKQVLLVAQHDASDEEPNHKSIYSMGCVATILRMLKLPDGNIRVLVEGTERVSVKKLIDHKGYFSAEIEEMIVDGTVTREMEVLAEQALILFEQYVELHAKLPTEILKTMPGSDKICELTDSMSAQMQLKVEQKQQLLEKKTVSERLDALMLLLEAEIELLEVEQKIRGRVKQQMEKSQREYYLNEQMKAIHKELGEMDEIPEETDNLEKKL